MEELLKRLSSYDLLNNLIPGGFLVFILEKLFAAGIADQHLLVLAIVTYLLGSVASRVGSLVVEPSLKKFNLLDSKPYADFIEASKVDSKIEILLQTNNTYRSICGAALLALGAVGIEVLSDHYRVETIYLLLVGCLGLVLLYAGSFRKQTGYLCQRIQHAIDHPPEKKAPSQPTNNESPTKPQNA